MIALAILAVAVVAAAVAYLVSLRLHPWRPCRACSGTGRTKDRIWTRAHGTCPACGGRGRHPRIGVRLTSPGRYKQLTEGQPKHKNVDRRGQ